MDICQFPFYVVPREQILKMERLLPHEDAKAQNLLLEITCGGDYCESYPYKLCGFRGPSGDSVERKEMVFISHRWLNPSLNPLHAHPDDKNNSKLNYLKKLADQRPDFRFYWLDYLSVPQHADNSQDQVKAINSLPCYVKSCANLVMLYGDFDNKASLDEYLSRGWCRLEQLSALLPLRETRGYLGTGEVVLTERWQGSMEGDGQLLIAQAPIERLNPLQGVFFDPEDKKRISNCLQAMCNLFQHEGDGNEDVSLLVRQICESINKL